MSTSTTRSVVATVAALVGAYLLYVAADPTQTAGLGFLSLFGGLALWLIVAMWLFRYSELGREDFSKGELAIREWPFYRFMTKSIAAAPLLLGVRLYLFYEWFTAGWHKITDPAWMNGSQLLGFWQGALTTPAGGRPPITFNEYRWFIQWLVDTNSAGWFSTVVAYGEIAIALGLLFGTLTGIAAVFALLMNFAFLFAGTTSVNPLLVLLEEFVVLSWRISGYYGLDRWILSYLGAPWEPRPHLAQRPATP
jgi:thiosulfate dehydrogenase (quinone) large subunit